MRNAGSKVAEQIASDEARKYAKRTFFGPMSRKRTACQCLVCGEKLLSLMAAHAAKHGYESKQAMIEAGMVKWLQR